MSGEKPVSRSARPIVDSPLASSNILFDVGSTSTATRSLDGGAGEGAAAAAGTASPLVRTLPPTDSGPIAMAAARDSWSWYSRRRRHQELTEIVEVLLVCGSHAQNP